MKAVVEVVGTRGAAWSRTVGAALACALAVSGALAANIKVLTAGAFKPVVSALAPAFELRTGHRLVVDNATAGELARRLAAGEAFDLVVLTPQALDALARAGTVVGSSMRRVAQVGIGVAVLRGAPAPDIGSVAAFKQALLAARAVATIDPAAGGSSGIYLWRWFEQEGLAAALRPKAVLVPGGLVATRLVSGEADLAIHQISEILAVPGATLVGPLPREIQNHTVYAGALSARAAEAAAAQAFLDELTSARARALLTELGMEAP